MAHWLIWSISVDLGLLSDSRAWWNCTSVWPKLKRFFCRHCSSRLILFINCWSAVTEQSEGRGQIELQIGEREIAVLLLHLVKASGSVVECMRVCVRVCVSGVVAVKGNAGRQSVELPSYHLAVWGRFTILQASVMNCWHHRHRKVNNLINAELK